MKRGLLLLSCLSAMPLLHALQTTMVARPAVTQAQATAAAVGAGAERKVSVGAAGEERKVPLTAEAKAATAAETKIDMPTSVTLGAQLAALMTRYQVLTAAQRTAQAQTFWAQVNSLVEFLRVTHEGETDEQKKEKAALLAQIEQLTQENTDLKTKLDRLEAQMVAQTATQPADRTTGSTGNHSRWHRVRDALGGAAIAACLKLLYDKRAHLTRRCEIL